MAWLVLFLAGLFEVGWAIGLKASNGFTKPLPTVVTLVFMVASFGLLAQALKTLPLGTAYAVWTGIGAVGTAIVGITFLNEPKSWAKAFCIALILAGIIGLKLTTAPTKVEATEPETTTPQTP